MMIKALPDELRIHGKELVDHAEEYMSCVKNIYNVVDSLSDTWKGTDNEKYTTTINGYKENITSLGQVISNYGVFIQETARDLAELQANIANGATRL